MKIWQNKKVEKRRNAPVKDNRIKLIMAIVFLFGLALVYRLVVLQVWDYDYYANRAFNQHQISSELVPERGTIYLSDYSRNSKSPELYPFAVNKDFADVYAVPKEILDPASTAENFYLVFKKDFIVNDVKFKFDQALIAEQLNAEKEARNLPEAEQAVKLEEIKQKYATIKNDPAYATWRMAEEEKEIEARHLEEVKKYQDRLSKADDVYEPMEKKVDDEALKKLYALLAGVDGRSIDPANLVLKNGKIILKQNDNLKTLAGDEEIKIPGIGFNLTTYRYYPEKNIGAHLLGFARLEENEIRGSYGLEGFFDDELFGQYGFIRSERSADKKAIILNNREYAQPTKGSDLVLTIDRAVQYAVCDKLKKSVEANSADGGTVIVMDPYTGAVVAMCSYPDFDPNNYEAIKDINLFNNPAVFSAYESGSIFKALTMAIGLDQEKVQPDTTYVDTGVFKIAGYEIKNSDKLAHGVANMTQVLEESLNTGVIFVMEKVGVDKFAEYIKNFGFGEKTGIELSGESKGNIKNLIETKGKVEKELYAATASFGQGISVTPLQMVSAFSAVANGGNLVKPFVVREIIKADGEKIVTQPAVPRRIISERASALLSGMLVEVVEKGHGKKAGVQGYYVAGKTGTAQVPRKDGKGYQTGVNIGSFAGFAPANNPRFAMLVRIDHPRNVTWAESSAAPLFGQIAEYLLNYYQVPKERSVGN